MHYRNNYNLPDGFDFVNLSQRHMHELVGRGKNPNRKVSDNAKDEKNKECPNNTEATKEDREQYDRIEGEIREEERKRKKEEKRARKRKEGRERNSAPSIARRVYGDIYCE